MKIHYAVKGVAYGLLASGVFLGLGVAVHSANHKSPGSTLPAGVSAPHDRAALERCHRPLDGMNLAPNDRVEIDVAQAVLGDFQNCVNGNIHDHTVLRVRLYDAAANLASADFQTSTDDMNPEDQDRVAQQHRDQATALDAFNRAYRNLLEAVS